MLAEILSQRGVDCCFVREGRRDIFGETDDSQPLAILCCILASHNTSQRAKILLWAQFVVIRLGRFRGSCHLHSPFVRDDLRLSH
jgi:hypothetical protein